MSADLTVVDVYESAAQIGKDLERLIDLVGSEAVEGLMPKVIGVLEQLEACVRWREGEAGRLQAAREEVRRLTHAQEAATQENLRIIAEVKELDEQRQGEIRDWMRMAKELQQQNGRLKAQLSEKEGIVDREKAHEQEAMQVLYKLKETVDGQREALHIKDDELKTRALEVDALQQHVDRLAQVAADLRRKNELLSSAAKSLIQDKSQLESELQALGKEAALAPTKVAPAAGGGGGGGDILDSTDGSHADSEERTELIPAANIVSVSMEGMAIIDLSDPDRPRFTLKELQAVLQERDELKLDIIEMQDELEQYRPKDDCKTPEPDQKERRRSSSGSKPNGEPSGIKRLFSFLFRGKNNSNASNATEDEGTWEFLEKPAIRADLESNPAPAPAQPSADQKLRSSTLVVPSLAGEGEGKARDGKQRSRSFAGIGIKASFMELFVPRGKGTGQRSTGGELETAAMPNSDQASSDSTRPVPTAQQPASSDDSTEGEPLLDGLEMTGEMNGIGKETTADGNGAPKILLNNNEDDDSALEM